jgi:hypothetical protein
MNRLLLKRTQIWGTTQRNRHWNWSTFEASSVVQAVPEIPSAPEQQAFSNVLCYSLKKKKSAIHSKERRESTLTNVSINRGISNEG